MIEHWPPEMATFLRTAGRRTDRIAKHNPDCPGLVGREIPVITSPPDLATYMIDDRIPPEYQRIPLQVRAAQDAATVYWFEGSQLIAKGPPEEVCYLEPRRGKHTLSVIDSRGRSSTVEITIY